MNPIIDVHAHIFCARDIPLKGYLKSRKAESIFLKVTTPILAPLVARCIRKEIDKQKTFLTKLQCHTIMGFVYTLLGPAYRQWAQTLSREVQSITQELLATYGKDLIDLYVPLVIDFEYWFENTYDTQVEKQISFIHDHIIQPYGGQIHPFVPFDPARELAYRKGMLNPDGKPETKGSLKLVTEAIEKQGFIGVKLYNSLGYKPWGNASVENQRLRIRLHREKKYFFTGEEYDEVLGELYDYCLREEVPITAHCVMNGIESYPGASFDFGQAKFWREVLDQECYRKLRLNLAHFGWNTLQGYEGDQTWVKDICAMMNSYEFLFTDVSCHRVVTSAYFEKFKTDYQRICGDFPQVKQRLLFGIDWHVIKRVSEFKYFKDRYIEILRYKDLFSHAEIYDFLGGNALKFLGLLPGEKNHQRLSQYYQRHHIPPPPWFAPAASSSPLAGIKPTGGA